jgi:hypothetical protein
VKFACPAEKPAEPTGCHMGMAKAVGTGWVISASAADMLAITKMLKKRESVFKFFPILVFCVTDFVL